ncbi:MAG TPA: restriction endonuclease subunit S [Pyrinomonadaceae bacterium]|nr:restriction endonuclease subunit S [Pyrinomonadaceae bacterium]
MPEFVRSPLGQLLAERGYIRGPFGSALVRRDLKQSGVPVYEQQHAITRSRTFRFFVDEEKCKELRRFTVRPNDLIISCSGTVGRVSMIREGDPHGIISQALLILRPDPTKIEPHFLRYFLESREGAHELVMASHGTVQVNIAPRDVVERIPVPVPELDEQRAIAHILGTLDDKIELNRQMNETLEAIARAIFKSWFVDFDPVRAKASGEAPESICRRLGLTHDLLALFPHRLGDSELGKIPEGWEVGSVDDEFEVTMGQSPPGDTYNETGSGLPFYQGRTDFGFRFPKRRVYCTAPTRLAKAGDTLVSVRAPVGDLNMAAEDCAIGRGVAAVRHKTGSRSYSYQFMHSIENVFARFEAEGTVFGSIGKKDFKAIACVKPPRRLVLAYEACISALDDRVEVNERESHTLAAFRDTLLPKLILGELRVPPEGAA